MLFGALGCSASQPNSDKHELDASSSDSSDDEVEISSVPSDASHLSDLAIVDIANPDPALKCEGPTLQELGLSYTTPIFIIMQIIRADTNERLSYPVFRTSLGMPVGIEFETLQDNVKAGLNADLTVNILPDNRLAMTGQFVWQELGQEAVVIPMMECISGFGPLPNVSVKLSNGVEVVTHISFLLERP